MSKQSTVDQLKSLARAKYIHPELLMSVLAQADLKRDWSGLSRWECDQLWSIYRKGFSNEK
jgi:hypothetical protein